MLDFLRQAIRRKRRAEEAINRPLRLPGIPLPVHVRRAPHARRLTMRLDAARQAIRVSIPPGVRMEEVARFVARHRAWLDERLRGAAPPSPFVSGGTALILGTPHLIIHDIEAGRGIERGCDAQGRATLRLGGDPALVNARMVRFLKASALETLSAHAHTKAATAHVRLGRVSVRDVRSRWGSCSPDGNLSFSWRLIMAPPMVADYVAAHEVAHLLEMNHSERFWRLCDSLAADADAARRWLRCHGADLHRYGQAGVPSLSSGEE
jgi:predicted metal-dependent hydrolase